NIHFVVEPLPPFENLQQAYLYIDEFRMNQVIQNLLQNAMKFTQPNGLIRVYASFLCKEDKMAIHVEDSGIGMTADELTHVFTRFYKVDASRSMKNGGMGLGLSISKEIINTHNGEITVTSEVNKGSIFTITLPVRFSKYEQTLQSEYSI
ncbi:MAG: sensor histidine kinase, partial [Lysinibacillus sp.]